MAGEIGEASTIEIKPDQAENKKNLVTKALALRLNVDEDRISELKGVENHLEGDGRFIYGSIEGEDGESGWFVKIGSQEKIMRESGGLKIAGQLGFPVVDLIVEAENFELIGKEECLVVMSYLDGVKGMLSTKPEQLVSDANNSERAERLINFAVKMSELLVGVERQIPVGVETESLNKGDWRNADKEKFMEVWRDGVKKVLDGGGKELIIGVNLDEIIERGEKAIEKLLEITPKSEDEYLVHNDCAPNNAYLREDNKIVVLDWEHAGTTHFENLAILTDVANFWARCWSNPDMQKEFVKGFLNETVKQGKDLNLAYLMMETTIIHGSLYLAKYGMDQNHHEHRMSVMLMQNLNSNLDSLEETKMTIDQHL